MVIDDLNQTDRELLERILMKNPEELSQEEVAVLNARRDYLSYAQRVAYKDILNNEDLPERPADQTKTEYTDPQAEQPSTEQVESNEATQEEPANTETEQAEQTTPENPYDVNPDELA